MAKLVVAKTYLELSEALVAKSVLEAYGFVAVLPDYHFSSLSWQYTFVLKGIRLWTFDVSLADAIGLLNSGHETGDLEELDEFELATTMTLSDALFAVFASMCGIPYPVRRRRYRVRPS